MAKIVRVAWTDPSPTTNVDHIEVWRSINAGAFAQVGADIALGVETLDDDNGGPGFNDSDDLDYSIRVYNSAGQYVETTANIVITGGVTYALAVSGGLDTNFWHIENYDFSSDVDIEFDVTQGANAWSSAEDYVLYISAITNVNTNGMIALRTRSSGAVTFQARDDIGLTNIVDPITISGKRVRITKVGFLLSFYVDGVLEGSNTMSSGMTMGIKDIRFGSNREDSGGTNFGSSIVSNLTINGETWDFAEQTGTTATGSLGTVATLVPGNLTVEDMWTTAP